MWARVVEFMLACWLAISPFIFRYSSRETFLWANDFICAFLIATFALLSFWSPLKRMHLFTFGVALWLWAFGYQRFPLEALPSQENSVVIGLLLLMLSIVPSGSYLPPTSWQKFIQAKRE